MKSNWKHVFLVFALPLSCAMLVGVEMMNFGWGLVAFNFAFFLAVIIEKLDLLISYAKMDNDVKMMDIVDKIKGKITQLPDPAKN